MAHTLVKAYLELPLGERDAALTSLVRSLRSREIGLLQNVISATRDPFHKLPTELLIYIFDSLHPYDIWSKRLVSRQWNTVLSSDIFIRAALNRFETHDPADSALDAETHASSSHWLALRHVLALRNGRPFSYVNYGDQFAFRPDSEFLAHQVQLKGKHIAYLRGNRNTVVIRDLVTGERTSLSGTAREAIWVFQLSTDIVAFFTHVGTVYIASLLDSTDSLRPVRLPSSSICATHADRGILACLLGGTPLLTMFIHDAETRKSTSFSLQLEASEKTEVYFYAMLVNSYDKTVDIFSVPFLRRSMEFCVSVVRYSLAGERMMHECLSIRHGVEDLSQASLRPILPTGERGLFQLAVNLRGRACRTLIFDANIFKLKVVDQNVHNTILWKDRLYRSAGFDFQVDTARRLAPFDGPHSLRALSCEVEIRPLTSSLSSWQRKRHAVDPRHINITHAEDQPDTLPVPELLTSAEETNSPRLRDPHPALYTIAAMNDTFAVGTCLDSGYIGVVCFDERVHLHGAGLTDLWAHPDKLDSVHGAQDPSDKQIGPGFLTLGMPKNQYGWLT